MNSFHSMAANVIVIKKCDAVELSSHNANECTIKKIRNCSQFRCKSD